MWTYACKIARWTHQELHPVRSYICCCCCCCCWPAEPRAKMHPVLCNLPVFGRPQYLPTLCYGPNKFAVFLSFVTRHDTRSFCVSYRLVYNTHRTHTCIRRPPPSSSLVRLTVCGAVGLILCLCLRELEFCSFRQDVSDCWKPNQMVCEKLFCSFKTLITFLASVELPLV